MKNILKDRPSEKISGRLQYCLEFMEKKDIGHKTILDIGCGFGWFEMRLIKNGIKKIIGTEITKKDLETARTSVKDKKVKFLVGNALKLQFPNNYFDTVVAWDVLEHIPKNTETIMFDEVARVLKKNGSFYLSTPNSSIISRLLDPAWWFIGHRHYSKARLMKIARSSSFTIMKYKIRGGLFTLLGILNMYISKWILRRSPIFDDFFRSKENKEYLKNKGFVEVFVKFRNIK